MSDRLRPLLDGDEMSHVSEVLRAGLDDDPSAESFARAARQLGLGTAVALTSVGAAAGAPHVVTGASSSLAVIAKWFAFGALMGGVLTAPLAFRAQPSTSAEQSRTVPAPPSTTLGVRVTPILGATSARAAPTAIESKRGRGPGPARAPEPAPANSAPGVGALSSVATFGAVPQSSLEVEVATLDWVRRALESGAANQALVLLDRYDRTPSPHALAAEAQVLRVRALMSSGRVSEAQRIARALLTERGSDGYACRLAKLATVSSTGCSEAKH